MIRYHELPTYVPGEILRNSDGLGWKDVALRSYRYEKQDVVVPSLADFMIVSYQQGDTAMERRFDGRWTRTECHPGCVSLLTRSQLTHWNWTNGIDVTHAYLSYDLMARVAEDVLDRPVAEIRLDDVLRAEDPVITNIVDAMTRESDAAGMGGRLYVDALGTQLALHMLRRYAHVDFRDRSSTGKLPPSTCYRLVEYIDSHLDRPLPLEELASIAGLGVWSFGNRFRESFDQTPHAFVLERRIERARRLLCKAELPVKAVASVCGFSDQAHLTRALKARHGITPAALRRSGQA
ncbi:MAG TPA: AraC family transcriptional regulator [Nevskiaceae bacterium]|nr:AraC family transcriptional regulator [Nevskiaceae bacterium]